MKRVIMAALIAVGGLAACGGGGGGASGAPDGGTDTASTPICTCDPAQACGVDSCGAPCGPGCADGEVCIGGACSAAASCDRIGFTALTQAAELERTNSDVTFGYRADSRAVPPFERLVIRSFSRDGGPSGPGTWPIAAEDYADCGLCVLGYQGCQQSGCARAFLADAGTLTIDSLSGGSFRGTLHGARFREVYINDQTAHALPVPNGETWCVEEFSPKATLVEQVQTDTCVAAGTGREVGDKIANFSLTNCLGEPVALHDRCGEARAVWVVLSAGWCSACAAHLPEVAEVQAARTGDGLQVLVVLGEDADGAEPSLAFCQEYAASMGLDPASVVIDWRDGESFAEVGDRLELYSDEGLGLPWDGVLDGLAMRYVWAGARDGGTAGDVVNDLLAR